MFSQKSYTRIGCRWALNTKKEKRKKKPKKKPWGFVETAGELQSSFWARPNRANVIEKLKFYDNVPISCFQCRTRKD
jgi:hypothetical protein